MSTKSSSFLKNLMLISVNVAETTPEQVCDLLWYKDRKPLNLRSAEVLIQLLKEHSGMHPLRVYDELYAPKRAEMIAEAKKPAPAPAPTPTPTLDVNEIRQQLLRELLEAGLINLGGSPAQGLNERLAGKRR